jgi:hypothetical protein
MQSTAVFSISQRISRLPWNLKFHYYVHMCHILSQTNSVCNLIPYSFKIYDLPRSFFPSGILTEVLCAVLMSPMLATCLLSHPPLFYHTNNIWWRAQIMKLQFYLLLLPLSWDQIFHSSPSSQTISIHLNLCSSLIERKLVLQSKHQVNHNFINSYLHIFRYQMIKRKLLT